MTQSLSSSQTAATLPQASSAKNVASTISEAAAVELEHADPAAAADFQGRLSPVHRLLRMRKASPARNSDSAALQRLADACEDRFPSSSSSPPPPAQREGAHIDAGALAWSVAPVVSMAIATVGPRAVRPGPERRLWRPDQGEPALSAHSSAPSLAGPLARHGANRPAADAAAAQDRRSRPTPFGGSWRPRRQSVADGPAGPLPAAGTADGASGEAGQTQLFVPC